jgi:ketosteroid isomerase-like protein
VQRGWDALLERYKRSYPDRAAMGHLTFSEIEITPLGPDAAVILGHWQLQRDKDAPEGVFTLVARRLPEGWRIIHDHTSAVATLPTR